MFSEYFPKKLIFLPKKTTDQIQKIDLQLVQAFNEFVFSVVRAKHQDNTSKWFEIFSRINEEIKKNLEGMETGKFHITAFYWRFSPLGNV